MTRASLLLPALMLLAPGPTVRAADSPMPRAFLKAHCLDCHGGDKPRGGLDLEKLGHGLDDAATFAAWVRVHDRVARGEMPPKSAEQPKVAERKAALDALRPKLHDASLARQKKEGRVLVRRLNRAEYENSLRDLLGVSTEVKSLLPEDTTVGGFDNITTGLETSATHLVRYQIAAERALADVLPTGIVTMESVRRRVTGRQFLDSRPRPNREGTAPFVRFEGDTIVLCATLYKHGSVLVPQVPVSGRYKVRASVRAVNNKDKPIPVLLGRISSDRFAHEKVEHILDIQDATAKTRVMEIEAVLPAGEQVYVEGIGLQFFGEMAKQRKNAPVGDDYAGPGLAVDWVELEGPLDAGVGYKQMYGGLPRVPNGLLASALAGKDVGTTWTKWHPGEFGKAHNRLRLVSKDPKADAEKWLRAFVPRAFRRPVAEEVVNRYVRSAHAMLDDGALLDDVMPAVYKAVLCSPHFLMLVEKPGKLDDHALASRLSYFLWTSMPDAELLALAAKGELGKPATLRAQAERMLKDRRAARFASNFAGQWLELRKIHDMKPDAMYVEFDDWLAWSMPEETRRFFDEVLAKDLPVSSFVASDWSMLNSRLAQHYGIAGVEGLGLRRAALPAGSHRGGLITQAAILKLTTNATYTSPVKRGAWVLERLLGTPPPPPPPNIAAVEPDIRGAVTIREQLAKHQSVAACASCHRHIDPPGFALENFDVIGGWRDFYRAKQPPKDGKYVELKNYPGKKVWQAKPVEAAGATAAGEKFADIDEYRKILLRDPDQLTRNLAEKLLTYGTGGVTQFADRAAVEDIVASARKQGHGFRSLIHEVVQSPVFRMK